MDTVFSVHHDSKVIRERNRLLKLQHGSVDDLASQVGSKRDAHVSLAGALMGSEPLKQTAQTASSSPPYSSSFSHSQPQLPSFNQTHQSLNSFERAPSQDKRLALHSLLSTRFGLSPAGTPQPSPPTSRASTPSNEVSESSLYANAYSHATTNSVNTNASTTHHPPNQSSVQPLVPAPSSLSSSPRLLPMMTPRAFQSMRKVVPVLEGDDIWNMMNSRPAPSPWLSIGKVEDGNAFNGNGGGLHGEKKE